MAFTPVKASPGKLTSTAAQRRKIDAEGGKPALTGGGHRQLGFVHDNHSSLDQRTQDLGAEPAGQVVVTQTREMNRFTRRRITDGRCLGRDGHQGLDALRHRG